MGRDAHNFDRLERYESESELEPEYTNADKAIADSAARVEAEKLRADRAEARANRAESMLNALQIPSTGKIFQREQSQIREAGRERERVESGQQRDEAPQESQEQA